KFYQALANDHRAVAERVIEKKSYILYEHMAGELENLFRLFMQSGIIEKKDMSSVRQEEMKEVIGEFLIHCPVYRYYGNEFPLQGEERDWVQHVIRDVKKYNPELHTAIDLFEKALLSGREELNEKLLAFYQRCMQFTGPLMAKGVEDTLMYTYNRFIGHNEVGDAPDAFGISVEEFHEAMKERQNNWPHSLNATSTHDTKRGEDVRARLNVLTDLGESWLETVNEWQVKNESLRTNGHPTANDEYFIYQSIVGAHPFPGENEDDFTNRIQEYLQKSLREAKAHSNWTSPNEDYENSAKEFAAALLDSSRPFRQHLDAFLNSIADHGIINSLAQTILKFTCPGIPDVYQGCELWDLSLVDPDNRRPVDFEKRMEWLDSLQNEVDLKQLWNECYGGKIKLWITSILLNLRRQQPYLFSSGEYQPLKVEGTYKDHIIAFARKYRQDIIVVVLPLHTAIICKEQGVDVLDFDWKDTMVFMPGDSLTQWDNLTGEVLNLKASQVEAGEVFRQLPFGLLKGQKLANERSAGILLHISSLPSQFGIGDMGPGAKAFVDFLQRSRQKYWQLLPL
ncbi:MAG TPA: 4-alpha-glucanotransferase, partial [Flavisolibacter sp.]